MLGLRFCARAFSSCGKRGPLFIAVHWPLTIAASLVAEHRLQMRKLSSCGSRAQSLRGMWDPPRPGLEPVSPALADRLSTTAPPGKPRLQVIFKENSGLPSDVESTRVTVTSMFVNRQNWDLSCFVKRTRMEWKTISTSDLVNLVHLQPR